MGLLISSQLGPRCGTGWARTPSGWSRMLGFWGPWGRRKAHEPSQSWDRARQQGTLPLRGLSLWSPQLTKGTQGGEGCRGRGRSLHPSPGHPPSCAVRQVWSPPEHRPARHWAAVSSASALCACVESRCAAAAKCVRLHACGLLRAGGSAGIRRQYQPGAPFLLGGGAPA